MRLVSRNYVGLNWSDINKQIDLVRYASGDIAKKRLKYFETLSREWTKAGGSSIPELRTLVHINITEPSFQELRFDILKMSVADETIFNAFVVACYRKNYTMAERIKTYLGAERWKKYVEGKSFSHEALVSEIVEDVREYILANGVSLEELLMGQEKRKIYNEECKVVFGDIFEDARFDSTKRFMGEIILNAYTTAIREGNVEMTNQIRPYVMKGFLDKQIDEDVMEYILCNGVSSEEYLGNPKAGLDESGNKVY